MYSIGKHHVSLSDIRQDYRCLEVFLSETPQGYPVFRVSFEGREYEVSFAAARLEYGMSPFSTKHEVMAGGEGLLDDGSGRYKLIGRAGLDDHYLHAGEWVDVWIGTQWVVVQVHADEWGRWYFLDLAGSPVSVQLGIRARLRDECCSRGRLGSSRGWECGCRALSLAFCRLAHCVPCVRDAPARGGVAVVACWVAWRLVRAVGGGCPLRGADRRRTNRGGLPLTLISVSHTSTESETLI